MTGIYDDPQQAAGFTLTLIFLPLCFFFTVLRFVATRRSGRQYAWDDWFALLAFLTFVPYCAYMILIFTKVDGRDLLTFVKTEPKEWYIVAAVGLINNGIYGVQQSFAKFSLLALYYRLFWVNRVFTLSVWTIAAIQTAWGLSVLFVHIFSCVPVQKAWMPQLDGYCLNINLFFSIAEPINTAIDFVIAGMAIWMLSSLQMKRIRKWGVAILFFIGAFSGILGIVKVVEAQHSAKRNFLSIIWNLVQMATSIICCCAPIYQSLLPKLGLYNTLRSWATGSFGTRKSSVEATAKGSKYASQSKASSMSYKRYPPSIERHAHWKQIDGSSERVFAWTEIETDGRAGRSRNQSSENIPMGTIEVKQSYQVV
ncbi:hypothetical protein F5Y16DRAFT_421408 [Xylariaceae sp. FL0255]|nr:hypothetical protein F5Y16DRAFT_421408 [Xylariaceae sp. FL0255]